MLFRDACDDIKTIFFIDVLESLSVCLEFTVIELDKAGCIVKGILRLAYEIAKQTYINDMYDAIDNFIAKNAYPIHIFFNKLKKWIFKQQNVALDLIYSIILSFYLKLSEYLTKL